MGWIDVVSKKDAKEWFFKGYCCGNVGYIYNSEEESEMNSTFKVAYEQYLKDIVYGKNKK